jgi:hypothetical protein
MKSSVVLSLPPIGVPHFVVPVEPCSNVVPANDAAISGLEMRPVARMSAAGLSEPLDRHLLETSNAAKLS